MAVEKEGEEWKEYNSAVRWMVITAIISVLVTIILALISMPLAYLIGNGISKESLDDISKFFTLVFDNFLFFEQVPTLNYLQALMRNIYMRFYFLFDCQVPYSFRSVLYIVRYN